LQSKLDFLAWVVGYFWDYLIALSDLVKSGSWAAALQKETSRLMAGTFARTEVEVE
jgi:hypothetical protein